jgi:hypothetical protein
VDPFQFTIVLPRDADSLPLLDELCSHLARVAGLDDRAARNAREQLEQVVREHLRAGADDDAVEVAFERKAGEESVMVEVTSAPAAGGTKTPTDGSTEGSRHGTAPQRLFWDVRRSG